MCSVFTGTELEAFHVSVKIDKENKARKLASCQMNIPKRSKELSRGIFVHGDLADQKARVEFMLMSPDNNYLIFEPFFFLVSF